MAAIASELARLRRFAGAMNKDAKAVDVALPAARALLDAHGAPYKLVGGIAVVHHGYLRTTDDLDVLVTPAAADAIARAAPAHEFVVVSRTRLLHEPTDVTVDLLIAGDPMPRAPAGTVYPSPDAVAASADDACIIALPALIDMKLRAHRHQDLADIVALVKHIDEARYLALESEIPAELRGDLANLRRDALEELASEAT